MPRTALNRDDRLQFRATREEKRLLATAAAYERLDVTSFVMRSALPVARKIVDKNERVALSARDSEKGAGNARQSIDAERGAMRGCPRLSCADWRVNTPRWREEPLGRQHGRGGFD
jgi:uncharacterized protein (DUF1778 family)